MQIETERAETMQAAQHGDLRTRVGDWLSSHQELLNLREIRRDVQDVPVRKLTAWYETHDYVIDIAAWEQAYCVGIMVLDKRLDSMIYAVGGRCESEGEATARLEAFARWLDSHQSFGGALARSVACSQQEASAA